MNYLKKFNESSSEEDIKQDILDNFIYISDKLGQPLINNEKWGNSKKWIIKWDLLIDVSVLNDAAILVNKLKSIVVELDDIISAKDRLSDFDFMVSLQKELIISMIPKDTGQDTFNFIHGFKWRELKLDISEIERFFAKKEYKQIKIDDNYNEITQMGGCSIQFNKRIDNEDWLEFQRMFNIQLEISNIDFDVNLYRNGNWIGFDSESEKRYITFL